MSSISSKTLLAIACLVALSPMAKAQDSNAVRSSETDILTIYKGPHSYKLVSVAGKTTEVDVDDKRVADGEIPKYDSLIQALRTEVRDDDREWAEERKQDSDREQAQVQREQAQIQREAAQVQREQAQMQREVAQGQREQAQVQRAQAQRQREQAQLQREQAQREREQAQVQREQAQREREEAQRDRDL